MCSIFEPQKWCQRQRKLWINALQLTYVFHSTSCLNLSNVYCIQIFCRAFARPCVENWKHATWFPFNKTHFIIHGGVLAKENNIVAPLFAIHSHFLALFLSLFVSAFPCADVAKKMTDKDQSATSYAVWTLTRPYYRTIYKECQGMTFFVLCCSNMLKRASL